MTKIGIVQPLGSPFMELDAREDGSIRVNTIFVPFCSFKDALKGNTFIFNGNSMKNLAALSVLSMLFSHLKRRPSLKLVKLTYETELGCQAPTKRFRTVGHQCIETREKMQNTVFLEEHGFCCIAGQRRQ